MLGFDLKVTVTLVIKKGKVSTRGGGESERERGKNKEEGGTKNKKNGWVGTTKKASE